jgi:hypothetical protein
VSTGYQLDDEVIVRTGPLAGQVGVIDELDLDDPIQPYRVRFDAPGDPVAWFGPKDIKHAAPMLVG